MADNNTIPAELTNPAVSASRRVSPWWRALAILLALVLLIGWAASASMFEQFKSQIVHLQLKLNATPQIRQIAVLLDDKQRAAMLVTFDPSSGVLQLQRLNDVAEGREDSMQLWAVAEGKSPRSLGVITSKYKTLELPASANALNGATELAISVEDKGGVPESLGPRLPYLFKGWLVQRAL